MDDSIFQLERINIDLCVTASEKHLNFPQFSKFCELIQLFRHFKYERFNFSLQTLQSKDSII